MAQAGHADHWWGGCSPRSVPRRLVALLAVAAVAASVTFLYWPRGLQVSDGRHDLGRNGIWIQHG